jgi:hypothetical protein
VRYSACMKALLTRIVTSPAGANAIGTIVGGIILAILFWLWTASGLNEPSKNIWPALSAVDTWLNTATHVRRGTILSLCLTIILVMGIAALLWLRGLRTRLKLERIAEFVVEAPTETPELRNESLPTDELPAAPPTPAVAAPKKLDPKMLTSKQLRLLAYLYQEYPQALGVHAMAGALQLRYPEMEQMCERLEATDLITVIQRSDGRTRVLLTKFGRDFYIDSGLGLLE